MEFDLAPEQLKRCEEIRAAVSASLPGRARDEPTAHFTREEWMIAARLGLTGLCLPERYGGGGLGALDTALCLEAFGAACRDTGLVFGVAAHLLACAVPVRDFASGPARDELLPGLADGSLIAANAMTEPGAGSDTGLLSTAARPDGAGHYVIDGVKSFASNAAVADLLVTYAVSDPHGGFLGLSAFAVPRSQQGITVAEPMAKMGLWGCPASQIRFESCRVPASCRLGEEGHGALIFQRSMLWERSCLFALYLGLMERQLTDCTGHARSRRQFGRPLGGFQAVSHRIADMRLRLEAARLLLYRACWLIDQGREQASAAALAKVAVSQAAVSNGLDAVQIFGGSGYLMAAGIEAQLRDSVPSGIFSGTTEIQKEIIARETGL